MDVEFYNFTNGFSARREVDPIKLVGYSIPPNGKWVLRNADGKYVDMDTYRNELIKRNSLEVLLHEKTIDRSSDIIIKASRKREAAFSD